MLYWNFVERQRKIEKIRKGKRINKNIDVK